MAIKPIDSSSTVDAVWASDPAFDQDASIDLDDHELGGKLRKLLDGYTKEFRELFVDGASIKATRAYNILAMDGDPGCWHRVLTKLPGQEPTVFVLGVIPPSEFARLTDMDGGINARQWEAFKMSLRDIRNGPDKDGKVPKSTRGGWDCVDHQWLDRTFAGHLLPCAKDLGMYAMRWNVASGDDIKN
jgi:hypothetical protein